MRIFAYILLFFGCWHICQGQWFTETYTLRSGWNAIYFHGDASYATPEVLFEDYPEVLEVWRWNSNIDEAQFTDTPLIPSSGTEEWTVWSRDGTYTGLTEMFGQNAYLIKCSTAVVDTLSMAIKQLAMPPSATWVRSGANLMGFPTAIDGSGNFPYFANYFSTFPGAVASNVRIYKYTGGDFSATNPLQIFTTTTERLDRTQAYWFDSEVVGDFYSPLKVSLSDSSGMHFGRMRSVVTMRLYNAESTPMTVTIEPVDSVTAPISETAITGSVPLTLRTYDTGSLSWTESLIEQPFNQVVGPKSSVELSFGIDRSAASMAEASSDAYFGSLLHLTDGGDLLDLYLPVSAQKNTMAGLWIGEVQVNSVECKAAGYLTDTETASSYPLRYLFHLDDTGESRLLSQVYLGVLDNSTKSYGICTSESSLAESNLGEAAKLVAAHLPLDQVQTPTSGGFALGSAMSYSVVTGFDSATNPFVHQYHPDHDNFSGSSSLAAGEESYDISRNVTFTVAATADDAPDGTVSTGYGTRFVAGTYSETITGFHKESITAAGTFVLQRISEIGSITTP